MISEGNGAPSLITDAYVALKVLEEKRDAYEDVVARVNDNDPTNDPTSAESAMATDEYEAARDDYGLIAAQISARIAERSQGVFGQRQRPGRAIDPAAVAERMIAARDSNADGVLSGGELAPGADLAALIDRFDTDDDNAWSEAEFAQVNFGKGDRGDRGGRGDRDQRGGWDGKRR